MFYSIPTLKIGDKPGEWELAAPLLYLTKQYDITVQVPRGFKTDLASIPRPFRNIININGKHRPAAIVHDYLYRIRGEYRNAKLSRADCDAIFKEAMEDCGVSWTKRQTMWAAVRIGGWLAF